MLLTRSDQDSWRDLYCVPGVSNIQSRASHDHLQSGWARESQDSTILSHWVHMVQHKITHLQPSPRRQGILLLGLIVWIQCQTAPMLQQCQIHASSWKAVSILSCTYRNDAIFAILSPACCSFQKPVGETKPTTELNTLSYTRHLPRVNEVWGMGRAQGEGGEERN